MVMKNVVESLAAWKIMLTFAVGKSYCITLNFTLMKENVNVFSAKSLQMLGRFGNYSYFCPCQGVADGVYVNHPAD